MWLPKSLLTGNTYTEHTGCVIPALHPAWVGSMCQHHVQAVKETGCIPDPISATVLRI